jgi:ABC-type Fe3+-hydroxamate transport system substrate-binding protein
MPIRSFTDQLHSTVQITFPPRRIISLVPSQTELLFDLGLENELVGITKFCIHPAHLKREKEVIGGTKNFNFDLIHSLRPDLIIGNKEENYEEGIRELKTSYPVWMSDIYNLNDAKNMIQSIGDLTDTFSKAAHIIKEINSSFECLVKYRSGKKVVYLIWKNPWMAAGRNTFINSVITEMGLANCLDERSRYPELSNGDLRRLNPELVFLSTEPFPFQQKHAEEIKQVLPNAKVLLVDGEMFSWYGSRLRLAPAYFNSLNLD